MNSESSRPTARRYVSGLAASGRYHFASREAQAALGVSAAATKLALNRLAKQKLIASPARGFYVILPPEYGALGCLPPLWTEKVLSGGSEGYRVEGAVA